jgi:ferredoxin-nitrite reductase
VPNKIEELKNAGTYAVGSCIPVGRTDATQCDELACLAERYAVGELRFTIEQNVIIVNVPDFVLPDLLAEPLLQALRPTPTHAERGTVSCIGVDYCNLALAETKGAARGVVAHLDAAVPQQEMRPLTMYWSGCPAACGNHQASDIGFLGGKARLNGQVVETFDVFVNGGVGADPRAGEKVLEHRPNAQRTGQGQPCP